MNHQPLDWLEALFADIGFRALPVVMWSANSRQLPITVTLKAGEDALGALVLDGPDLINAICAFAAELQDVLQPALQVGVPPCPSHARVLVARRTLDLIEWQCPEGDFSCRLGAYEEALWPPGPDESYAALMLAKRLSRHGLSFVTLHVDLRDGAWVASIALQPDTDERFVREVVAPLAAEISRSTDTYTAYPRGTTREPPERARIVP